MVGTTVAGLVAPVGTYYWTRLKTKKIEQGVLGNLSTKMGAGDGNWVYEYKIVNGDIVAEVRHNNPELNSFITPAETITPLALMGIGATTATTMAELASRHPEFANSIYVVAGALAFTALVGFGMHLGTLEQNRQDGLERVNNIASISSGINLPPQESAE